MIKNTANDDKPSENMGIRFGEQNKAPFSGTETCRAVMLAETSKDSGFAP